ncbi:hypothetical protein Avbf_12371, partial [Armadillidium vulgare]
MNIKTEFMDIKAEFMDTCSNDFDAVQEKDGKENPPSTSQENFQVKQEVNDIEDFIDENTDKVCSYFVTDGLTFEKEFVSNIQPFSSCIYSVGQVSLTVHR